MESCNKDEGEATSKGGSTSGYEEAYLGVGHGGSSDEGKRSTKTVAQGAKRAASLDPPCASRGLCLLTEWTR